jgi:hypothetical protein
MSDDGDNFLARWSKRKQQARSGAPAEQLPAESALPSQSLTPKDEPDEIPVEDLPAIESIDATTDLTPWLRRKVSEEWKRAALSRVWAADPAISRFTGLADYDWDWNVPDGVPGFGPLRATDDVAELLAQAIGKITPAEVAPIEEIAAGNSAVAVERISLDPIQPEMPKNSSDATIIDESLTPDTQPAPSPGESANAPPPVVRRRRGGSALPS